MGIKRHTQKSLSIVCTDMEISYRKKTFPNAQSVIGIKHKICCTACGRNLMKETDLLCSHPAMDVIICKECLQFYGDGLFKTDKKGDDVYCRWCAQGGTIYCCSKCSVAFCKKCIERNLKTDKKVMADINKDTWACFICVSKPLWNLRALCWAVQKYKKDLRDDSRKRKLSTSSVESDKFSKPGPASAKKTLAGPASKKVKLDESASALKKPGPASKTLTKRPGPASLTKVKTEDLSDDDRPIQTRHKKIDYSPKIEFPTTTPKPRKPYVRKAAVAAKNKRKRPARKTKSKFCPDVSSDEEFDDFEDEEDDESVSLENEVKEPVERIMEQVLDFCFKLSNNFNTKLIKYGLAYKGNLDTSDKVNNACVNLHMDLKKIVRLYNAIDEKMMNQLDNFNAAQQALENEKLDLSEPITGDIDLEEYDISAKTPEPEITLDDSPIDDSNQLGETMEEGTVAIPDESEEQVTDKTVLNEENLNETVENGQEDPVKLEEITNGTADSITSDKGINNAKEDSGKPKEDSNNVTDHMIIKREIGNGKNTSERLNEGEDASSTSEDKSNPIGDDKSSGELNTTEKEDSVTAATTDTTVDNSALADISISGKGVEESEENKTNEIDTKDVEKVKTDEVSGEKSEESVEISNENKEVENSNAESMEVEETENVTTNNITLDASVEPKANETSEDVKKDDENDAAEMRRKELEPAADETKEEKVENGKLEEMEVEEIKKDSDNANDIAQANNKADIDGLSDISDKSDPFTDNFDQIGTKETAPSEPNPTHSNGLTLGATVGSE
ncbi:hypothetical protein M8J77_004851 [Diaphorina citri]|nr:hypothetical protein M8J77_004851 [Diaphorina citri]